MMMDINEFKSRTSPNTVSSKLAPFEHDIIQLHKDGYSHIQIVEYLSHNGCKVSQQAISKFLRKRLIKQEDVSKKVDQPEDTSSQQTHSKSEKLSWAAFRDKTDVESLM